MRAPPAPNIPAEKWDEAKDFIRLEYLEKNASLKEVQTALARAYQFDPTLVAHIFPQSWTTVY